MHVPICITYQWVSIVGDVPFLTLFSNLFKKFIDNLFKKLAHAFDFITALLIVTSTLKYYTMFRFKYYVLTHTSLFTEY